MAMIRWSPFEGMDQLFHRFMPTTRAADKALANFADDWTPSADISETEKEYLIRAHLPAVKREDVKVTVEDGMVTIAGERKRQLEDKTEKFHRVESFHGSFSRSFYLPADVEEAAIRCDSGEGVFTVHLPKRAMSKPAPVEIKVN